MFCRSTVFRREWPSLLTAITCIAFLLEANRHSSVWGRVAASDIATPATGRATCPTLPAAAPQSQFQQHVGISKSVKSEQADVILAVIESLSFPVDDGNKSRCERQYGHILNEHRPIPYMLNHRYGGMVTGHNRTDWGLKIGYTTMDTCSEQINGSYASLAAVLGSGQCQRGHLCSSSSFANLTKVFMMLGPTLSSTTSVVAPLLTALGLPTISPTATNDEFTCQAIRTYSTMRSCSRPYSAFHRTSSSDFYQAKAVVGLMKHFGWTVAISLGSNNIYGSSLLYDFGKEAAASGICVAYSTVITEVNVMDVAEAIANRSEIKVIVLLSTPQPVQLLFDTLVRYSTKHNADVKRVYIGSDGWSHYTSVTTNSTIVNSTLASLLSIGLSVHPMYQNIVSNLKAGFLAYIRQLQLDEVRLKSSDFVCRATEQIAGINCSFCDSNCDLQECQARYNKFAIHPDSPLAEIVLLTVEIAVRAVQVAMDEIASSLAPTVPTAELTRQFLAKSAAGMDASKYLSQVEVECGEDGRMKCRPFRCIHEFPPAYELRSFTRNNSIAAVGKWFINISSTIGELDTEACADVFNQSVASEGAWNIDNNMIDWSGITKASWQRPSSFCHTSKEEAICPRGYQHMTPALMPCCIACEPCQPSEYVGLSEDLSRDCRSCKTDEVPSQNQTRCVAAEPQPVDIIASGSLVAIGLLGCVAILFVALVFHRHANTPIVKGSDWRMTFLHMLGICGGFLSVGTRLWKPTVANCVVQEATGFLFFTMTMAVSLVKISRFARLVSRVTKVDSSEWTFSNVAQIVYVLTLCGIGLLLYVPWRIAVPPRVGRYVEAYSIVHLYCDKVIGLRLVCDIYILVLIVVTCILGFITRKLPENYNEARSVFMSAMGACIIWLVTTTPYYADALDQSKADLFLSVRLLAHMWSLLLWMYAARVYIILFQPKKNRKSVRKSSYLERTMTRDSLTYRSALPVRLTSAGEQPAKINLPSVTSDATASNATPTSTATETPSSEEQQASTRFLYPSPVETSV